MGFKNIQENNFNFIILHLLNLRIKIFGLFPPFYDFTMRTTKFYSVLRVGAGMTQFDAYLASLF